MAEENPIYNALKVGVLAVLAFFAVGAVALLWKQGQLLDRQSKFIEAQESLISCQDAYIDAVGYLDESPSSEEGRMLRGRLRECTRSEVRSVELSRSPEALPEILEGASPRDVLLARQ